MAGPKFVDSSNCPEPTVSISDTLLYHGDAFDILDSLPESIVDAVVTDPPYNYEDGFLQEEWDDIGSSEEYQEWCRVWGEKCKKVLSDDGILVAFSSNRQHHQLTTGIENAGFDIVSTAYWFYGGGLPKAPRLKTWLDDEQNIKQWGEWRGMLKPAVEYVTVAIPSENEFAEDLYAYEIGDKNSPQFLLPSAFATTDTFERVGISEDTFHTPIRDTSRFIYQPKASVKEKTHDGNVENDHATVKPISVMSAFIQMTTNAGDRILDPFAGTATTSVAAVKENRKSISIEQDSNFFQTAVERVRDVSQEPEKKTVTLDEFIDDSTPTSDFGEVHHTVPQSNTTHETSLEDVSVPESIATHQNNSVHAIIGTAIPELNRENENLCDLRTYHHWCTDWAEDAYDVLTPGGHVIAFGGSRTHHHLSVALEENGFEIRDAIVWIFDEGVDSYYSLGNEVAVMARKPVEGSAVQNQVDYGVGNLDIESCRVTPDIDVNTEVNDTDLDIDTGHGGNKGRYPSNVLFSTKAAAVLDAQSGISVSSGGRAYQNTNDMYSGGWAEKDGESNDPGYGDEGGASRYFQLFDGESKTLQPVIGNEELVSKPYSLYQWFEQLVTADNQTILYPFADGYQKN